MTTDPLTNLPELPPGFYFWVGRRKVYVNDDPWNSVRGRLPVVQLRRCRRLIWPEYIRHERVRKVINGRMQITNAVTPEDVTPLGVEAAATRLAHWLSQDEGHIVKFKIDSPLFGSYPPKKLELQ